MFEPDFPPPYADPLRDVLGDLENSIEGSTVPGLPPLPDFIMDVDSTGQLLGALESSIEGRTIPPPFTTEPPELLLESFGPILIGPRSEDPPPPPESNEKPWIAIQPAQGPSPTSSARDYPSLLTNLAAAAEQA